MLMLIQALCEYFRTILYMFDAYIICLVIEWSKGLLMASVFAHCAESLLCFMSAALLLCVAVFLVTICLV